MRKSEMILDKLYSVQLYDYLEINCLDVFRVLDSSHFNGFLIANVRGKLIFNLQNGEGTVIIPIENIKWMVPIKEKEKKEKKEKAWLDDLQS